MEKLLGLVVVLLTVVHQALSNQPPQLYNFQGAFFVAEDTPVGTVLGVLAARDLDDTELDFALRGDIANSILELVRISPLSMNIRLKGPLDREVVDQYTILCEVRDKVNTIQRYATLYVTDTNDNPPSFQNLPYRAEVSEDAPVGTTILKVTATDPDTGVFALVSYNISPKRRKTNQDLFDIDGTNGRITLLQQLDYETEKFYQLEIMAQDQGGLNSTTVVIINVKDVQDTAPFFLSLPYMVTLPENTTVGTTILNVSAMDGDRGVPNPIAYKFSGATDFFAINASTGAISVKSAIDRESPAIRDMFGVIELYVQASEVTMNPQGPTTAVAPVTINIQDVNDERPTFSQSVYNATVAENTQARIPITFLPFNIEMIVSDYDQGDNGRFELLIQRDGQPFDVFEVYPQRVLNEAALLIRVKNPDALDYETTHSFSFEVIAREYMTMEHRESSALVEVQIQDMNDNWPVFAQDQYKARIPENSPINTPVITLQAHDPDSGIFGKITYYIRGPGANRFRIDADRGKVVVGVAADLDLTQLDREKLDTHYLTVEAVDRGGLRSSVQLEVMLTDVNDNPPTVSRTQYEGYVTENNAALDRPIVIQAFDIDLPPNNVVTYEIVRGDQVANFHLDNTTGELTLAAPLDYETQALTNRGQITLVIRAKDGGVPSLQSTVNCTIYVKDANDETPVFPQSLYTAALPENSVGGTNVSKVMATDADLTAPNNEVIYRIESGARDKFRIDADTGALAVETGANLDRDRYGDHYTLNVLAIDRGTPSRTGSTTVLINITDINNKVPEFLPPSKTVRVSEGLGVGSEVAVYTANDTDLNAQLQYSLLEALITGEDENKLPVTDLPYLQSLFRVDQKNGTIFVASPLDRERVEEIKIRIFVEDKNAFQPPVQTATAELTIVLQDINDNAPEFVPSSQYTARISEASQPGSEVKQVLAVDKDKTPGPIRYYLNYTSVISQSFEITDSNRETGLVTLRSRVDREANSGVNLLVRAVDNGQVPMTGYATIKVDIEDVNDNSPKWVTLEQNVYVSENATVGMLVTQVSASDDDTGQFSEVRYFITSGSQGEFLMDPISGKVTVGGKLDRELVQDYILNIEARDNTNASISQQRITPGVMRIILQDVNDCVPRFEQDMYIVEAIQENAGENSPVVTVRAVDLDQGANSAVLYAIDTANSNSSDLFAVIPTTGMVYVNKALRGNTGWFHITITASDQGTPPLSNSTNVYIFIADVNDHKPEIIRPLPNSTIYLYENLPAGTLVASVHAEDLDQGVNGEVRYSLIPTPSSPQQDWLKFIIDPISGNITTAQVIDRESQEVFLLEVRAYDKGTPSYEDRATLHILVLDQDDNPPEFDRITYPPPYQVSVREEESNTIVGRIAPATDPDAGSNAIVCYYIVGGDKEHRDKFSLNKTSGVLVLRERLDREVVGEVKLVIKATEDCWSGYWDAETLAWNETDTTLLLIQVIILDVNDNPPRFLRTWFTAGVTRDSQLKEPVIDLKEYITDADSPLNQERMFYMNGPVNITEPLKTQLKERNQQVPFILEDGVVLTNIYFQPSMQGYFDIPVLVNDSVPGHKDTAKISIYLLNDVQRAKVIIRGDPQEIGKFKDHFAQFLSNITGFVINVDKVATHKDRTGKPDERKVDMFIHAINPASGEVLESTVLIDLIDKNYISLDLLFKEYNVIEIVPAMEKVAASNSGDDLRFILILIAVILFILLVISCIVFFTCRNKYKRKLKAATALAFENNPTPGHNRTANGLNGSAGSGLNHLEMPGTNLHSYEGSNPVWLEYNYENPWPPGEADTDSKNSLDENALRSLGRSVDKAGSSAGGQGPVRGPKTPKKHPYSYMYAEQEVTLEMYNDQYDHYNKPPTTDVYSVPNKPSPMQDNLGKPKTDNLNGAPPKPLRQNGNAPHSPVSSSNSSVNKHAYENPSFINDPRFEKLKATDI